MNVSGTTPLLVYDRIDSNRRKTRLLLALFPLALPVVLVPTVLAIPLLAEFLFFGPRMSAAAELVILVLALVSAALAIPLTAVFLIWRYGSHMLLRLAHARPLSPGEEPDIVRIVQNLCIGAGLPLPHIHLVESMAPNAFATGSDPRNASLVVTRGLLRLLDHHELEGVIAHELSHIGNHDIRLTTTLAALVGIASLPLRCLRFTMCWPLVLMGVGCWSWLLQAILFVFIGFGAARKLPAVFWWVSVTAPIVYVLFVSPVLALLIRQAVSRQREFLADADAVLLTRDPEALALALVKIGAAGGNRLRVGEGSVHLYFVDPLEPGASLLHRIFPSHPPLQERIELLARMGSGIAPSALKVAREAGEKIREAQPDTIDLDAPQPDSQPAPPRLEAEADGGSYVQPAVSAEHTLIPLYEQPDGWSRVLAQLPESAVVTPVATEGDFIRVTTAEHQAGYVSRSAPLIALKDFRQ